MKKGKVIIFPFFVFRATKNSFSLLRMKTQKIFLKKEASNASDRSLIYKNKKTYLAYTSVSTRLSRKQLNLNDFAAHFLDALLLTERG